MSIPTPDFVEKRRTGSEFGVIDAVAPKLSAESCIGPSEVRRGSGFLVLVRHEADELVVFSQAQERRDRSLPRPA